MEPTLGSWLNQELYEIMLKRQSSGFDKVTFRNILPWPNSRTYSTMYINELGSARDWYGNQSKKCKAILKQLKIRLRNCPRARAALRRGSGVAGKGQGKSKQLLRKARGERLALNRQELLNHEILVSVINKISTELNLPSRWIQTRDRGVP